MQTLYIDRKGTTLEIKGGRLLIQLMNSPRPFSAPLNMLEFLVISASVSFSSTLMTNLSMAGVTVVFLNVRKQEATCIAHGFMHNDSDRRLMQYKAISNPELQSKYAKDLVSNKLRGQRATLVKALRKRPDQRYTLSKDIERLADMEKRAASAESIDSLRGIEGAGAAMFFEAYQTIFASQLNFNGRNRRPPRDPVNAVLSLSYTLLHAESVRVLAANGFDPNLGVYHLPSYGRESLACDLVELYRPLVDSWVWRLFADETIRHDHFASGSGAEDSVACLLGKAGRSIYYSQYESQAKLWRKLMRKTARHWLNVLPNDLQTAGDEGAKNVADQSSDLIDFGDLS